MALKYRAILFLVILIWFTGIFTEWFIKYDEHLLIALPFLKKSYSLVCHQQPAKLILFDGGETLTCARCTGIYAGALISAFVFLFSSKLKLPGIKFLFIPVIFMLADIFLYSVHIYSYSKNIAFITGLLLGSAGFFYLYAGLKNLIIEIKNRE